MAGVPRQGPLTRHRWQQRRRAPAQAPPRAPPPQAPPPQAPPQAPPRAPPPLALALPRVGGKGNEGAGEEGLKIPVGERLCTSSQEKEEISVPSARRRHGGTVPSSGHSSGDRGFPSESRC